MHGFVNKLDWSKLCRFRPRLTFVHIIKAKLVQAGAEENNVQLNDETCP